MRVAVPVFPGSNCDHDALHACGTIMGWETIPVWHQETRLPEGTELVFVPGGFSYGDYLRCGAIAALAPIMADVKRHADNGGLVLGVCNGFQILTEAGLLPGALLRNAGLRFLSMDASLKVERADTVFTRKYKKGQVFRSVMAHGDGNYYANDATLDRLEGEGLVAFRYAGENLNGSARAIAGVFSPNLRILGMMPHPEDMVDPLMGGTDGKPLFDALAAA